MSSRPGERKPELIKLTVNGPKTSPTFIVTLPSCLGKPSPLSEPSLPKEVPHQEEKQSLQNEASLQAASLQEGTPLQGEASVQEGNSLQVETFLQGNAFEDSALEDSLNYDTENPRKDLVASSSCCGSMYSEPEYDDQHLLHTVAVWTMDSNKMDEKSMEVEVEDEARMLKTPNDQSFDAMDDKIVLIFFKPNLKEDPWAVPRPYETDGEPLTFDCSYGGRSPRWDHPPSDDGRTSYEGLGASSSAENGSFWGPDGYSKNMDSWEY